MNTVGHNNLTARGRWMAAVLACGDGAALSHLAAAALHDLRTVPTGLIDVRSTREHSALAVARAGRPGIPRLTAVLDGWAFHRDRRTFEADRRRDAALLAAGWRVLRITHERPVGEPDRVLGELRGLLDAQRAA